MADTLTPTPEHIQRAAACIQSGGVIAYPTETVYGLGADPRNAEAVARIFSIKGRAADRGFILLIRGAEDLPPLISEIPQMAKALMAAFWPGPLTLIFKARPDLPPALLGDRATIAVRHSGADVAQALLHALNGPITSTSANRTGQPPAQSAAEVASALGDDLDLILDGGIAQDARPSTLADVSGNTIVVRREGRISSERITAALQS